MYEDVTVLFVLRIAEKPSGRSRVRRFPRVLTTRRNVYNDDKKCPLEACRSARDGVRHRRCATRDNFDVLSQKREGAQTV